MTRLFSYFQDSLHELSLVTWLKQDELLRYTIISVVFVLLSGGLLGLLDFGLGSGYTWLLNL